MQARLQIGDFSGNALQRLRFGVLLHPQLGAFLRNLRTPPFHRFGCLLQLHELELEVVTTPLL